MISSVQSASSTSTVYFSLGPSGLVLVTALIAVVMLLSSDSLLAGSALVLLLLMAHLVWRLGELPVLFLALGVQWDPDCHADTAGHVRGTGVVGPAAWSAS